MGRRQSPGSHGLPLPGLSDRVSDLLEKPERAIERRLPVGRKEDPDRRAAAGDGSTSGGVRRIRDRQELQANKDHHRLQSGPGSV